MRVPDGALKRVYGALAKLNLADGGAEVFLLGERGKFACSWTRIS